MFFCAAFILAASNLKLLPIKGLKNIKYISLGNNKVIDIFQQACDIIRYILKPILKTLY